MVIVVGGMIGLGKSSVAKILGEYFGTDVFYESVEGNPILPLFYTASPEEIQTKRYPFLLQLYFLDTRFKSIKEALVTDNNVLDRSIYEDWYFAKKNMELGRISELEMQVYENLADNMMEELKELPKKSPDLMVYLKGSFETVLNRIRKRGRSYELEEELVEYYRFLWEGYDEWVAQHYKASQVLVIDMDKIDVVGNPEDAEKVITEVMAKLEEIRGVQEPVIITDLKIEEKVALEDVEEVQGLLRDKGHIEEYKKSITEEVEDLFTCAKVTEIKIKSKGI